MEPVLRNRIVAAAAAGIALVVVGTAWLQRQAAGVPAASTRSAPEGPISAPPPPVLPLPAAPTRIAAPVGLTGAQWQALQAELASRPDGASELRRIADYFAWSDLLRRFRETAGATDAATRRQIALDLDAGLSERLRQGEVSAAEARQIKVAILEVTLDSSAERAAALQRWLAFAAAPAREDPRQAEFEQRQAVLVAAWGAQPVRDRQALERDLEALRRQVYANSSAAIR